ncbi:pectate lyase [Kitasatospora sp. NBC_00240]|uniref:pectate lyase n=1 Tax=Kitasatospora sp. NBC_00240 TaxID=2903567 RepID=UPI002B1DDB48|nr:pectate lyase [Kitasatospora sp. NBC_00240]
MWPTPTVDVPLTATQQISAFFDGGGRRFVGKGALGSGGQSESQPAMFELADGAVLQNVVLGDPAADGVHCNGSCTLKNVWWENVGEDAATLKGSSAAQVMTAAVDRGHGLWRPPPYCPPLPRRRWPGSQERPGARTEPCRAHGDAPGRPARGRSCRAPPGPACGPGRADGPRHSCAAGRAVRRSPAPAPHETAGGPRVPSSR